jgi:hypothetical protein
VPSRIHQLALNTLSLDLEYLPNLTEGIIEFPESWDNELIGDKAYPTFTQSTSSALECFKMNAEAFCSQDADENYICDLTDMSEYHVRPKFIRYGGTIVLDKNKQHVNFVSGLTPEYAKSKIRNISDNYCRDHHDANNERRRYSGITQE